MATIKELILQILNDGVLHLTIWTFETTNGAPKLLFRRANRKIQ